MKTCFKCGVPQPLSNFYKHPRMADGHLNKCKTCTKSDIKADYRSNRASHVAYEQQREQTPERKAAKAEARKKHRTDNPDKYKARTAVSNALRDGRLIRQPCRVCGKKAQAHHEDYSKPLEVDWLCFKHHRELAHDQITT